MLIDALDPRLKMTADYLNQIASGIFLTGVFGPLVAYIYGPLGQMPLGGWLLAASFLFWTAMSAFIHWCGLILIAPVEVADA
jgi:hypothetical protein